MLSFVAGWPGRAAGPTASSWINAGPIWAVAAVAGAFGVWFGVKGRRAADRFHAGVGVFGAGLMFAIAAIAVCAAISSA